LRIFVFRTDGAKDEKFTADGELEDAWSGAEERASIFEFCGEMQRQEAERQAGMRAAEITVQTEAEATVAAAVGR
jgi:hypothetical protein